MLFGSLLRRSVQQTSTAYARCISGTAITRLPVTVTEDAKHTGLFYHVSTDTNTTYISFLRQLPEAVLNTEHADGRVIGWQYGTGSLQLTPSTLIENAAFRKLLNDTIRTSAAVIDTQLIADAENQREGWLHVTDARNPAPWGRIPDPEDIFGSIEVRSGHILPDTFQPMPAHRLVTTAGLFRLSDPLWKELLVRMHQLN